MYTCTYFTHLCVLFQELALASLKDAYTPLLIDVLVLAARIGLTILLLEMLAGPFVILAIPLATSVIATAQAILLCGLLVLRLHRGIKIDKGMERLKRTRANHLKEQAVWPNNERKQVAVEESVL